MSVNWNFVSPPTRTSVEKCLLRKLLAAPAPWPSQIEMKIEPWPRRRGFARTPSASCEGQPHYRVRIRWKGKQFIFVAEAKGRSTPSVIDAAIQQAKRCALLVKLQPMIIVPYLDEARLERLAQAEVSGIDLSGNGMVIVPGRLLLRRAGNPNLYPESQPMRFVYRGATSVVARAFLCRSRYSSVRDLKEEIDSRGGEVALSTVSKALKRMIEDVLIDRSSTEIRLIQPDALLARLAENFQQPKQVQTINIKSDIPIREFLGVANLHGERRSIVLSGASSQDRYTAGLRSDTPLAYCKDLATIRASLGDDWEEHDRSASLTIVETEDRTPFFDARRDADGILVASPVQAFLELVNGEKRDREMAQTIREQILRGLK